LQRTAIRRGRWKLLDLNKPDLDKAGAPAPRDESNCELYDLLADPGETTNVAAGHPDVVKALMDKLKQIRGGASA
jgi:arylsulfatase A-like enzyme